MNFNTTRVPNLGREIIFSYVEVKIGHDQIEEQRGAEIENKSYDK